MYDESKIYSPNCLKPENIGFEKKLYHPNNSKNLNIIEEFLSKHIELPVAPILKKLRNKEFPQEYNYRERLSLFFGTLLVRNPASIDYLF